MLENFHSKEYIYLFIQIYLTTNLVCVFFSYLVQNKEMEGVKSSSSEMSETCLSRTWTLEALRGLALAHLGQSKRGHLKTKKEVLTYLLSLYPTLCCLEHDLTCGPYCHPLRHRSVMDDRRLSRHRDQKIFVDYFIGCFLTDLDLATCLAKIRTLVPDVHELDQIIALPCYIATRIPQTFAAPSAILGESLDNSTSVAPLGVVIDPSSNLMLGILTSEGILHLSPPYQDHPESSTLPTLQATPELATKLLEDVDCALSNDQKDHVLGLIRPHGTVVLDQGGNTIAVLWWQHRDIPLCFPLFLDVADHVLSAKTTRLL
jgi:hypothetical protein